MADFNPSASAWSPYAPGTNPLSTITNRSRMGGQKDVNAHLELIIPLIAQLFSKPDTAKAGLDRLEALKKIQEVYGEKEATPQRISELQSLVPSVETRSPAQMGWDWITGKKSDQQPPEIPTETREAATYKDVPALAKELGYASEVEPRARAFTPSLIGGPTRAQAPTM